MKKKIILFLSATIFLLFFIIPSFFFVNYKLDTKVYKSGRNFVEGWVVDKVNNSLERKYSLKFSYKKLEFLTLTKLVFKNAKLYNSKASLEFKQLDFSFGYRRKKIVLLIKGENIFLSWQSLKSLIGSFDSKKIKKSSYYSLKFKFTNLRTKFKKQGIYFNLSLHNNIADIDISIKKPIPMRLLAKVDFLKQTILPRFVNKDESFQHIIQNISFKNPLSYFVKNGYFKIDHDVDKKHEIIQLLTLKEGGGYSNWQSIHKLRLFYDKEKINYSGNILSKTSEIKIDGKYLNKTSKNKIKINVVHFLSSYLGYKFTINDFILNLNNKKINSSDGKFLINPYGNKIIRFSANIYGDLDKKNIKIDLSTKDKIDIFALLNAQHKKNIQKKKKVSGNFLNNFSVNVGLKEIFYDNKKVKFSLKENDFSIQKKKNQKFQISMSSSFKSKKLNLKKLEDNSLYLKIKDLTFNDIEEFLPKKKIYSWGKIRGKFTVHVTNSFVNKSLRANAYIENQNKIVVQNSSFQKKIWNFPVFKNKSSRYDSFDDFKLYLNYKKKEFVIKSLELENQHYLVSLKNYSLQKKKSLEVDFFFNQFFYDQYLSTGISANFIGAIVKNNLKNQKKNRKKFEYLYNRKFK